MQTIKQENFNVYIDPTNHWPDVGSKRIADACGVLVQWAAAWLTMRETTTDTTTTWQEFVDQVYAHGGGWSTFSDKWRMDAEGTMRYPDDPPLHPLMVMESKDGKHKIRMYEHAIVSYENPDVFEVARMD